MKHLPLAASLLALVPLAPIQAHPHVFVGADVTVIFKDGAPSAIKLGWVYDDYFSLLITSDLGIDLDGDLVLSAQEKQTLSDAVTEWPKDYEGDMEVYQNGEVLPLSAPIEHTMQFENGIVVESFVRPLASSVDASAPLTIKVFDPFYYVSYEIRGAVAFEGRDDCKADIYPPDLHRANSLVEELLYGRAASDVGPDEAFPEVGVEFAETVIVTCAG